MNYGAMFQSTAPVFQNHYGWIETTQAQGDMLMSYGFQNHYGWIETWIVKVSYARAASFKTTTVGLRQSSGTGTTSETPQFQNHYGWIETERGRKRMGRGRRFQNHYGWIETWLRRSASAVGMFRFKTTTVGLRLDLCEHPVRATRSFKTTTVGLRPNVAYSQGFTHYLFQNHYGWIETLLLLLLHGCLSRFKTTTVGLRRRLSAWCTSLRRLVSKPLRLD